MSPSKMGGESDKEVSGTEKKPVSSDDTLKARLIDLKRRYRVINERFDDSGTPAAAAA